MNVESELQIDGISFIFLHLLWMKYDVNDINLQINIPDTIIYDEKEPIFWYYTSKVGIKKKKQENITNEKILSFFTKKKYDKCNVVATFLYNYSGGLIQKTLKNKFNKEIICHFFTLTQLSDFLENKEKPKQGILQKFIIPSGLKNS